MTTRHLRIIKSHDWLVRVARVLGASSAAALTLADYDRRRKNGERVAIFQDKSDCLFVGPIPRELDPVKDS